MGPDPPPDPGRFTSGPALFDDDLACDVRDVYQQMLQDRISHDEATRRSIGEWSGLSPDEDMVFWLALASVQSTCGRLDDAVRARALEVLDAGADLDRWRELGPGPAAARAMVLEALRKQLTGPQPARKTIRRPWRYVTDLAPETALMWTASNGSVAVFRVVQMHDDPFTGSQTPVLERLKWTGNQPPSPEVLAGLSASDGWLGWEPVDPAANGRRPAAVIPLRLRKRDPDWGELGFSVCGHVPARPGDDADGALGVVAIQWDGLVGYHENRLATWTSEQR